MKKCNFIKNLRGGGTSRKLGSCVHCSKTQVTDPTARWGFTLAEVLVTLGIIGVVSAMTLPTLVKNHQRTVYVTQLHKVYNEMSQAFEQVITDSNAVRLQESQYGRNGEEWFLRNYFKTSKICTGNSVLDCFGTDYKNINGASVRLRGFVGSGASENSSYGAAAVLADGVSIYINGWYVTFDVNGKQGPNILGRDLFDFMVDDNGTINIEGTMDDAVSNFSTRCISATSATWYGACLAKILNDGWKMDY